ncbi:MAG: DUF5723 family protein [Bacteroidaceae bacterium]|nr:DUF5723 family protein [Bacteroidaceae bacterium]
MKRNNIGLYMAFAVTVCFATSSYAQSLNSSYFLEGSFTRHEINPAFAPERDYFTLPALGGYYFGAQSTVGASDFIFDSKSYPGKLTTFMSRDVDRQSFLGSLPSDSRVNSAFSVDVLSFGFRTRGGYAFLGLKIRGGETVSIPKEMFEFMKSGLSTGTYSVSDAVVSAISYADLEFGESRRFGDNLTLGAKIHMLAGIAYGDVKINSLQARLDGEQWRVRLDAESNVGLNGLTFQQKSDGTVDVENPDYKFNGLSGWGLAFDLGAEYDMSDIVDGLRLSASVTDLGFLRWGKGHRYTNNPEKEFLFDGFHDVEDDQDLEDQCDQLSEDFQALADFYDKGEDALSAGPAATVRFGAEYALPGIQWLSAGELITLRTGLWHSFESRTSVNMAPARWFDASLNVAFSTFGTTMGWMLDFHPRGFNFFIGSDGLRIKLSKDRIPMEATSADVQFGVRFPIGMPKNI